MSRETSSVITSYPMLDRKSSIENEPRTLNIHQIQFARDAALTVLNNTSFEEAIRIFTEGLEPVVSCVHDDESNHEDDDKDTRMDYIDEGGEEEEEERCNLLRIPCAIRDIASAPF